MFIIYGVDLLFISPEVQAWIGIVHVSNTRCGKCIMSLYYQPTLSWHARISLNHMFRRTVQLGQIIIGN
jgi:hypothetical protein